ncbi:hypothetical protein F8388_008758 [Cannabis sativa]|uniref:Uncharacterized protein n=1 Tax=Cannabis sativa TaxID=3483 RepID=A0A7J6E024_CANSA|nr:hypothetical protein F8388_008758 [Cannabis sativa]
MEHMDLIDTILAWGGLAKLIIHSRKCSYNCEYVLLGVAILGSVAARKYSSVHDAMKALNAAGQVIHPSKDPKVEKYHKEKYRIFSELYEQQISHRSLIDQALS